MSSAKEIDANSIISLREITKDSVLTIIKLDVSKEQHEFVAPIAVSIAQAYFHREKAWFRAIYANETPVGFVMIADDPENGKYYLWRYLIDHRYQKLGIGKKAMKLIIERVKQQPNYKAFHLSYVKAPGGPEDFYKKLGFQNTGEIDDGEYVMEYIQ